MDINYEITITKDMISDAAILASESLLYTASYVAIFETSDSKLRKEYLKILFDFTFTIIYNKSPESFYGAIDKSTGKLICFYMLVNSDDHYTLLEKIYGGLILLPFYLGLSNFVRLIKASNEYQNKENDIISQHSTNQKFFALNRMVVHKDYQGKGIGSKCLSIGLKKADQLNKYIILSTQDERNVLFYQRLGFIVKGQRELSNYTSWYMVREPNIQQRF